MLDSQSVTAVELHLDHFKNVIKMLVQKFQPLQIICFGRRTFLTEGSGSFMSPAANQRGDYCLLAVTESSVRADHEMQDFMNAYFNQGSITILCHSKEAVNNALKSNSRFFIDVYTHGQLLYSHDGLINCDVTARFVPGSAAADARQHFDHRMALAEGFLHGATECFAKQQYNVSTFILHQVVEQCCIALIRVHLAYRFEVHNLQRLLHLCLCFSDRPLRIFISGDREDERIFNVLVKSYSQSRYKDDFIVVYDDARVLQERVVMFVELTKELCGLKILELR